MFAAERAKATKADAGRLRHASNSKFGVAAAVTVGEAAKEAGVSRSAVHVAKHVLRSAAPEVVEHVKAGRLTVHATNRLAALLHAGQLVGTERGDS